jgi:hypothetical protein
MIPSAVKWRVAQMPRPNVPQFSVAGATVRLPTVRNKPNETKTAHTGHGTVGHSGYDETLMSRRKRCEPNLALSISAASSQIGQRPDRHAPAVLIVRDVPRQPSGMSRDMTSAPPAGFEPATHGLGNRRSIP